MTRTNRLETPLTPAQCEDALLLVLQSRTFARSEKLQRFLKYVSDLSFRGEASLIHERRIAVEVFGRAGDYSPGEDSVVRRQAHALRHKLRDYYADEGTLDPVQIELPVGSYAPLFRLRGEGIAQEPVPVAVPTTPAPAEPPPPPTRSAPPLRILAAAGCIVALATFAAGWMLGTTLSPTSGTVHSLDAAVRELWGPWLVDPNGATLCLSNPPGTTVRQFDGPLQVNPEHQGLSVTPEQSASFREFFRLKDGGSIYLYPVAAQAKMGEALAAVALTTFFTRSGLPVHAAQSRFLTWETVRKGNLILLGHADSNQWIEPVLRSSPFRLAPTDPLRRARILNPHPQPGEQSEYAPTLPQTNKSYALLSMLPNVDGSHEVLVIGGLDTSSTTAATEYLVSPDAVRELLRRLRSLAPNHRGPWHFQLILETDVRDTVAVKASPVALRIL